jgi:hypothetical protein
MFASKARYTLSKGQVAYQLQSSPSLLPAAIEDGISGVIRQNDIDWQEELQDVSASSPRSLIKSAASLHCFALLSRLEPW